MALYFKDVEITNIDNLVPQTGLDITDLWFGSTNVYTVWAVYEGAPLAAINANGDDMRQYQVWGNTGGVGDKTINYFDYTQLVDGYTYDSNGQMILNPDINNRWRYAAIPFIQVTPETTYLRTWNLTPMGNTINFYDSEKTFIARAAPGVGVPFTVPNNCHFITFVVETYSQDRKKYMFTEGTTPPASFVPFGYEVDISTSDGTTSTTIPIYIGDTALQKDEYIDYQAQKVYRMINGVLTPTDPPVPLPALPTCEGTTIVDYAGQSVVPEKMLLKYRKKNF